MNFELTEEQRMMRDTAAQFAKREVAPKAAGLDHTGRFPSEIIAQMGPLGLMGVAIPEKYGGAGMDTVSYVLAMEEISAACASTGVIMSVNNSLVCDPIYKFGNEAQKQKYLAPLARGEKLGCFALSEPEAGSDASAQKTVAVKDGASYVINGTKNWITNGKEADYCVLFCMTDKAKGHKGISAFIVERGAKGFSVGKIEDKLGIKASSTASLVFEDCRVPADNLIGQEGQGFTIAMATLDGGRIGIAAQALGIARAALSAALAYAKERKAFGKPIADLQAIQFMLADMAAELDGARLLTYKAATLKDKGVRHSKESAMAKLFASETATKVTHRALQIHGGYGYVKDFPVERHYRDARITEIYEGTSEIQRLVIASNLLKETAAQT